MYSYILATDYNYTCSTINDYFMANKIQSLTSLVTGLATLDGVGDSDDFALISAAIKHLKVAKIYLYHFKLSCYSISYSYNIIMDLT